MGVGLIMNKLITLLSIIGVSISSYASECTIKACDNLMLPPVAQDFISQGYEDIEIKTLNDNKYLFLSTGNNVNKCSIVFDITGIEIDTTPFIGGNGKLCNVSEVNGNIVSSYRDQGVWFNDVYQWISKKNWVLLFTDSCSDCLQVKRIYYINGIKGNRELLSEGDDFSKRKPLNGVISVQKASLYSLPNENKEIRAYLVRDDVFGIADMSEDGFFYQISYKSKSGKNSLYWIKSNDIIIK